MGLLRNGPVLFYEKLIAIFVFIILPLIPLVTVSVFYWKDHQTKIVAKECKEVSIDNEPYILCKSATKEIK